MASVSLTPGWEDDSESLWGESLEPEASSPDLTDCLLDDAGVAEKDGSVSPRGGLLLMRMPLRGRLGNASGSCRSASPSLLPTDVRPAEAVDLIRTSRGSGLREVTLCGLCACDIFSRSVMVVAVALQACSVSPGTLGSVDLKGSLGDNTVGLLGDAENLRFSAMRIFRCGAPPMRDRLTLSLGLSTSSAAPGSATVAGWLPWDTSCW
mmetsp:Transcript_63984/g.138545  ORF Transcript_63984/g.138545 Transcript_63984/m.138545 type:complete len:208 (+) Transcript_63984:460-1083(+)